MSDIARAWDAFMDAIVDARNAHARGADDSVVAELVRHAREMLDVIEDAIADNPIAIPSAAGAVLMKLRGRLQTLEQDVGPVRH
ncbi:MAG TPA: hypothetical protein VGH59_09985 [Casimicrobiaceae bacterium]|jgi:hypothetical protein